MLMWSQLFPDFFFFNDTATTEIYTLSLHDALPICVCSRLVERSRVGSRYIEPPKGVDLTLPASSDADGDGQIGIDRKSTRLNSSHLGISYAVFCLKKKTAHEMYEGRTVDTDM